MRNLMVEERVGNKLMKGMYGKGQKEHVFVDDIYGRRYIIDAPTTI